ncbi:MAG: hypothetical protein ACRCTZ_18150 [Sarcina sp.]
MKKKDIALSIVEQALEVIKNLTEEELLAIEKNKKEFVIDLKEKVYKDEKGSKKKKTIKKAIYIEKGSALKNSKCESSKNEKENKNIQKRSDKLAFEKTFNEQPNEFDLYIRELSRFRSREEATKYLLDNKLTVTKLKILAKKLSIYIKSKSKKIDIIEAIVEDIVGSMLKLEALREY